MYWFYETLHGVSLGTIPKGINFQIISSSGFRDVFSVDRELTKEELNFYDIHPVCPKCGARISFYPAISRCDNQTRICADCGMIEALDDFKSHCEVA